MAWLINEFLPADSVSLGRLVRNVEAPQQDYHVPDPSLFPPDSIAQLRYEGFQETLAKAEGSKLHTYLTKLFSVSRNAARSASSDIESAASVTYQLKNSGEFFAKLCADPKARAFLTRAFNFRKDVYLVTGLRTLVDAKVTLKTDEQKDREVTVEVPVEEILLATGVAVPPGIIGGAGATVGANKQASSQSQYSIPGQVIYAVQFRKLKFSLFSRYDVDSAYLEDGNRWQMFGGARDEEGVEGGEDDEDAPVLEVLVDETPGGGDDAELKLAHASEALDFGDEQIVFVSDKAS